MQPASGIAAGQQVTVTATVENSGSGPAVDPFWVDFSIDDQSVGKIRVLEVLGEQGITSPAQLDSAGGRARPGGECRQQPAGG
ncbi:MAG: hypothetical protein U5J82_15895 [Desulfobacterales bacterium]|nr:hypothetical protein [Desulfobacterales bacterium]